MARILLLYFCEFSGKREIFPRGLPLEKWQNIDNIVLCIIEMFPIHTLPESQLSSENLFSIKIKIFEFLRIFWHIKKNPFSIENIF